MTYKTTTLLEQDNFAGYPCIITSGQDTTNPKDRVMPMEPTENNTSPRYVAYSAVDSYVEADMNLAQLLAVLKELVSPDVPEDVAVWEEGILPGAGPR